MRPRVAESAETAADQHGAKKQLGGRRTRGAASPAGDLATTGGKQRRAAVKLELDVVEALLERRA